MFLHGLLLWTSLVSLLALGNAAVPIYRRCTSCRCFPGEACWPSLAEWASFNKSLDGRLIPTVPLGKPCHAPFYREDECDYLRDQWTEPEIHYESSSSIMAPWFANGSCDPFHPIAQPCLMGNYIAYAVNVSRPTHISQALAFATKHNLRVVVRNTGHDYNGKSTGAGALGIWTHHLKDIDIRDYHDAHYTGKAIKLGAGVQGMEAYEAADAHGFQVVGGECPTVGIAGGYSQGGGHSALASRYGLAADQVLEWEVIDGKGNFITATRDNKYRDLYWALSGGGGGTYGVVWSMTSKLHTSTPTSGLNLTFTNANISQDTFYEAVALYHSILPSIVDVGAMSIWFFTNTSFYISPLTGPGIPVQELEALVQPFRDGLEKMGIAYTFYSAQFPTYLSEFDGMMPDIPVGEAQYGGWLIPRSVVQNNNTALTQAYRQITEDGATFIGVGLNVSKALVGDVYNAVLPAWRDALIDTTLTTPWKWDDRQAMLVEQYKMTYEYLPLLERLAPNSGAYMNEGDFRQPNFQRAFYGVNYPRLRQIKAKYDPNDIFYAQTAVGSDEWTVFADGRLCRV
ncbi:FAD-binding domain-containing protein [Aspergillus sclerotioniger CBS 115572]|uniref:FAD-binding domain-containing protein n=1 Tax=Aspergillus sclerotioniger CBS 115572 TaxID=1450535 RepID=A0A317W4E7_9EURO|nr:FAD-binding domain-containing protein [Aspergillus sclerotioniger CBS 115572]PWY80895.1 FAD-binding domain-containing protein [Aspergillus sclerotioniger CBS 115572]